MGIISQHILSSGIKMDSTLDKELSAICQSMDMGALSSAIDTTESPVLCIVHIVMP